MKHRRFQQLKGYMSLACRLIIGGLFVYASIYKILDPGSFAVSIRNYMILPPSWSNLVALTLPWIELGAGTFLILGINTRPSAIITTFLLGVFLCAIIYAYSIGLDVDCGCFSSAQHSEGRIGVYHLVRDITLFLISLCILLLDKEYFSLERLLPFGHLRAPGAQGL